ncbi:MAG: DUF3833 domain-containing protein [Kiloniellales bacterium]|nr:DUF3833 domain-containing protein [Kiloniellales bacterium]
MKTEDFADKGPPLDLFEYFEGQTTAWGWFEDRFGDVRRQFRVSIDGTVSEGKLVLDEDFLYDDGEKDRRVWTITRTGPNSYSGTADDVIGEAAGTVAGNALNWTYRMLLPIGDSEWEVTFDDWMFLQEGGVLLNRAVVSKWGVEIGRVSIFFTQSKAAVQPAAR